MNTESIKFFLNLEPQPPTVTHQEKKFGGVTKAGLPIFYEPPALAAARSLLRSRIAPFAPNAPWTCPVQLSVMWIFRKPKSAHGSFKTTKPDTDNLQKMLKDVLTECGFWRDDALVVREIVEKRWLPSSDKHGILISITDLTDENND